MKRPQKGTLYLLHFSKPFKHARHYLGFTKFADAETRVLQHQFGQGSNLTKAVCKSGIELYLAWQGQGTRADERRLKTCSHVSRWCPICVAEVLAGERRRRQRKAVSP